MNTFDESHLDHSLKSHIITWYDSFFKETYREMFFCEADMMEFVNKHEIDNYTLVYKEQ